MALARALGNSSGKTPAGSGVGGVPSGDLRFNPAGILTQQAIAEGVVAFDLAHLILGNAMMIAMATKDYKKWGK